MSEVIVITSGKGGVGKTTTVANIGTGLAMPWAKRVAVVDTDIGLRNLDVVHGPGEPDCLQSGGCHQRELPPATGTDPGSTASGTVCLLPSAQTKDKTAVSPEQMIKLTDDLRENSSIIFFWTVRQELNRDSKMRVAGADRALVVTTPEVSAIRDADRIIGLLEVRTGSGISA